MTRPAKSVIISIILFSDNLRMWPYFGNNLTMNSLSGGMLIWLCDVKTRRSKVVPDRGCPSMKSGESVFPCISVIIPHLICNIFQLWTWQQHSMSSFVARMLMRNWKNRVYRPIR